MTKVDENIQTAQNLLSGIVERCYELEEENEMLHKEQGRLHRLWSKDTKHIAELEEENKKLKERIKDHQLYEEKLEHRIIEFEELLHGE